MVEIEEEKKNIIYKIIIEDEKQATYNWKEL
jgi:hypothetical protein